MTSWWVKGQVSTYRGRFHWQVKVLKRRRFWFSENLGYRSGVAYSEQNARWCVSSYVKEVTGQDWDLK